MLSFPSELHYTLEHQWIDDSEPARVGITDLAQNALGAIVYVGLPRVGSRVVAGQVCGEVESAKSVSDIYAPCSGTVVALNEAVDADPSIVNESPYDAGWLFTLDVADRGALISG